MKKRQAAIPAFCLMILMALWSSSIYEHRIKTIEGPFKQLSQYQGKKILVITLPIVRTGAADSLLNSIDSLGDAYETSLKIIAVPSNEDGFVPSIKNQLRQWYRLYLDSSILITDGIYTRKTSGAQQHQLFKWLTHQSRNGYFNEDVTGSRMKFFVRANGELFGVLGARSRLGGQAVQRLIQAQ